MHAYGALLRAPRAVLLTAGLACGRLGFAASALALELVVPALASRGSATSAGLFFAVMAGTSALGGILYGARRRRGRADVAYAAALLGTTAGLAPLALVSTQLAALPFAALGGLAAAPSWIALYELLDDAVPAGRSIEALAWITGGQAAGIALGSALAGWLARAEPTLVALALPSAGFRDGRSGRPPWPRSSPLAG